MGKTMYFVAGLMLIFSACDSKKQGPTDNSTGGNVGDDSAAVVLKDYGKNPEVFDIEAYTKANGNFRTALWTGSKLQVTLMTIPVGGDIGLEAHHNTDQFLRIEEGKGRVLMGKAKDSLTFKRDVVADDAILVPADEWHNIVNTGDTPLKLYSIYAPAEHPYGTVHKTQADAIAEEGAH